MWILTKEAELKQVLNIKHTRDFGLKEEKVEVVVHKSCSVGCECGVSRSQSLWP